MIMIDDIKSFGFQRDVQKNRVNIIELIGRLSLQSLLREASRESYRPEKQIDKSENMMEKQNMEYRLLINLYLEYCAKNDELRRINK